MANRIQSVAILSLLMILGVGVRAQSPQPTPKDRNAKAGTRSKAPEGKIIPPQRVTNLQGFGTTGRIPKFGGGDFLVNSLIFESFTGKIGVGTTTPGSALSVNGQIETLAGGIKFPDGSEQMTAGIAPQGVVKSLNGLKGDLNLKAGTNLTITSAGSAVTIAAPNVLTDVVHDNTLKGSGTAASPLSAVSLDALVEPAFMRTFSTASQGIDTPNIEFFCCVPAGNRLVVEHVSVFCNLPSGQRIIRAQIQGRTPDGNLTVQHFLTMTFMGVLQETAIPDRDYFAASQPIRMYLNPGAQMVSSFQRSNAVGIGQCGFQLSGYLIPFP
jgi:hypothetical protein